MKAFLDDFAQSKCFDPLNPDNWYNVEVSDIDSFRPVNNPRNEYRLYYKSLDVGTSEQES